MIRFSESICPEHQLLGVCVNVNYNAQLNQLQLVEIYYNVLYSCILICLNCCLKGQQLKKQPCFITSHLSALLNRQLKNYIWCQKSSVVDFYSVPLNNYMYSQLRIIAKLYLLAITLSVVCLSVCKQWWHILSPLDLHTSNHACRHLGSTSISTLKKQITLTYFV